MKIDRLEVVPYSLAFREPYVTARGRLDRRELVLLRLQADGVEGLGEGAPLSLRAGQQASEIAEDLDRRCRPLLEGAELEPGDWSAARVSVRASRDLAAGRSPLSSWPWSTLRPRR